MIEKIIMLICLYNFNSEASIDIQSFKFSNQIETARQIAMRLPNKMCLYVKDHPLMFGFRKNLILKN